MTKKILVAIFGLFLGIYLCGFGYSTSYGHPLNTICVILGIILFLGGFVYLVNSSERQPESLKKTLDCINFSKDLPEWNHTLYRLCLFKINGIKKSDFDNKAFGSWYIETNSKRLVYDGRDSWLILQDNGTTQNPDKIIKKENLNDKILFDLLKSI